MIGYQYSIGRTQSGYSSAAHNRLLAGGRMALSGDLCFGFALCERKTETQTRMKYSKVGDHTTTGRNMCHTRRFGFTTNASSHIWPALPAASTAW